MDKHTPGPWFAERYGVIRGGALQSYIGGAARPQIASAIPSDSIHEEERQANASLIAAAPELLFALRYIMEQGNIGHIHGTASSAIAKATGTD